MQPSNSISLKVLTAKIQQAAATENWSRLQQLDDVLRTLLLPLNSKPKTAQQQVQIKALMAAHRQAYLALQQAQQILQQKIATADKEKERLEAYQSANNME
ncbi:MULTISPECIES: hypothetical protein [unclassified Photobacterium]|uniref:hypothetical protein n=1 Tax=unclassified Photobacterium TaxID=2628852 RepID=UPI000D165BF5|nr:MULTISPECIES: hypothetical protein [unclassified Photobacterium]PSV26825.1 hypothetical protein C9J40_20775 [Photobacterium sp. GB-72]PSV56006.1 hypothetical protein C9J43_13960 [Photobacterium sp. GB-3]